MSTQAKTKAREKRHARWLARTTRQRAQGEDRRSGDERDEEGMTTLDYLVGMREFREKSKGLQTINHGPNDKPVSEEKAEALKSSHQEFLRQYDPVIECARCGLLDCVCARG